MTLLAPPPVFLQWAFVNIIFDFLLPLSLLFLLTISKEEGIISTELMKAFVELHLSFPM